MTQHRVKYFGPPGTGKTKTLLDRVAASGVSPERVGFVTFTRTAREEALHRLGGDEASWPLVRTLHSLCYRGLSVGQGRLVGPDDLQRFSELVGVEIRDRNADPMSDEESFSELPLGDQLLRLNHLGRHRKLRLLEAIAALRLDVEEKLARHFTVTYRDWKRAEGLLDYTDLLTRYVEFGRPLGSDLFIVDEAQDLSPLQWDVAHKLGGQAREFVVAGDDDQAIYSWAGAVASQFIDWEATEQHVLHQSYRLPRDVWDKVQQLSERIEHRAAKAYLPKDEQGYLSYTSVLPELERDDRALVLYRYGARGKQLARELRDRGVCFGGPLSPLSRKEVRLALQALAGNASRDCLQAARSLSSKELPRTVADLNRAWYHDYLMHVAAEVGIEGMLQPRVTLSSIHQAKGRQAPTVILDNALSRASYEHLQLEPDDEHRVWYVGASRASEHLVVLESGMGRYEYEM